ncbi:MAG: 2Fe-2S iron-sulfur cluster-binding protein [Myxococcota bacterium]|nr:2Fe-2S iron-sulfur cluster-binding protein [Myxococcota bacterium]
MSKSPRGLLERVLGRGKRLAHRVQQRSRPKRLPEGTPVEVDFGEAGSGEGKVGQSLLQVARELDIDLDHFCGGRCSCGTCRIIVSAETAGNLSRPSMNEELALGAKAAARGDRLACQARLQGPVSLRIPSTFNGA